MSVSASAKVLSAAAVLAAIMLFAVPVCGADAEPTYHSGHGSVEGMDVYYTEDTVPDRAGIQGIYRITLTGDVPDYLLVTLDTEHRLQIPVNSGVMFFMDHTLSPGNHTITVSDDTTDFRASCPLMIGDSVTGIVSECTEIVISSGQKMFLDATVIPSTAAVKDIVWVCSGDCVTVSDDGILTAVSEGIAEITAKPLDNRYRADTDVPKVTYSVRVVDIDVGFDAQGGEPVPDPIKAVLGGTYGPLPQVFRADHDFAGWYLGDVPVTSETIVSSAEDHTLTARWTPVQHSLMYTVDGRTYGDVEHHATGVQVQIRPQCDGFGPWQYDGKAVSGTFEMPAYDVVLSAVSEIQSHQVIYKVDGVQSGGSEWYAEGAEVRVRDIYSQIGYTSTEWILPDGLTGPVFRMPGHDITIVSQTSPNVYSTVFDANGGSGTMASQHMTYDSPAVLTLNSFERPGFVFAGWNTVSDGSGTSYLDGQAVMNLADSGEVVLFAQWNRTAAPVIVLNATSLELGEGDTFQLTAEIVPAVPSAGFRWFVSAGSSVTVDSSGLVTAVSEGTSTVLVMSSTGLTAECSVTVSSEAPASLPVALIAGGVVSVLAVIAAVLFLRTRH